MSLRAFVLLGSLIALTQSVDAVADAQQDKQDAFALSAVKYFGTTAGALYTAAQEPPKFDTRSKLADVAGAAYKDLQASKAAASVTTSTADLAAAGIALSAFDPEPMSHTVIAVSSYAIQQGGQFASSKLMEQAEQHVQEMIATQLARSAFSPEELAAMPKEKLLNMTMDIKVGGQSIREMFKDSPGVIDFTNAAINDLQQNITVASLLAAKKNGEDIAEVINQVKTDSNAFSKFRAETEKKLGSVGTALNDLNDSATKMQDDLTDLQEKTEQTGITVSSMLQVSFQGWTPQQKLDALNKGMFPDLPAKERDATTAALTSQIRVEKAVNKLSGISQDLGNVSTIARALKVDESIVTTIDKGQVVVAGVMQFASGNYLGAIASMTGLLGAGKPDPMGAQFKALYGYLDKQFAKVNESLEDIKRIQQQTLEKLDKISDQLTAIQSQISEVNRNVLLNGDMLRILVVQKWAPCQAFINKSLYGKLNVKKPADLYAIADDRQGQLNFDECYRAYTTYFFDSNFAEGNLKGGELDARIFADPAQAAGNAPEVAEAMRTARSMPDDYSRSRDYYIVADPVSRAAPGATLLRFAGPAATIEAASRRDTYVAASAEKVTKTECGGEAAQIDRSLWGLICGTKNDAPPTADDWNRVVNQTPIGFQSARLVNIGIALSGLANLTTTTDGGRLRFPTKQELVDYPVVGPSHQMIEAVRNNNSDAIALSALKLAQNFVIQQTLTYGDVVAKDVFATLYDPRSPNTLATESAAKSPPNSAPALALAIMKGNPVVARNVVMLAVSKALLTKNSVLQTTFYTRALVDFMATSPCSAEGYVHRRLNEILPNWKITYRRPADADPAGGFKECKAASSRKEDLSGLAVEFEDFYVKAPAPAAIAAGAFEQPPSLLFAIALRDKAVDQMTRLRFGDFVNDAKAATYLMESGCLARECGRKP